MKTNALKAKDVQSTTSSPKDIVPHIVGFVAAVLAAIVVAGLACVYSEIRHSMFANIKEYSTLTKLMFGGAYLYLIIGAWSKAAAMTRKVIFTNHEPSLPDSKNFRSLRKPKIVPGKLEHQFQFLNANGEVIFQSNNEFEIGKALLDGRIRLETPCQSISRSGKTGELQALSDSFLAQRNCVWSVKQPLEYFRAVGATAGGLIGFLLFILICIAIGVQGYFTGLSGLAKTGAIIAIAAETIGSCCGIGLNIGFVCAEKRISAVEKLGYTITTRPPAMIWQAAILLASIFILGILLMLSLGRF